MALERCPFYFFWFQHGLLTVHIRVLCLYISFLAFMFSSLKAAGVVHSIPSISFCLLCIAPLNTPITIAFIPVQLFLSIPCNSIEGSTPNIRRDGEKNWNVAPSTVECQQLMIINNTSVWSQYTKRSTMAGSNLLKKVAKFKGKDNIKSQFPEP